MHGHTNGCVEKEQVPRGIVVLNQARTTTLLCYKTGSPYNSNDYKLELRWSVVLATNWIECWESFYIPKLLAPQKTIALATKNYKKLYCTCFKQGFRNALVQIDQKASLQRIYLEPGSTTKSWVQRQVALQKNGFNMLCTGQGLSECSGLVDISTAINLTSFDTFCARSVSGSNGSALLCYITEENTGPGNHKLGISPKGPEYRLCTLPLHVASFHKSLHFVWFVLISSYFHTDQSSGRVLYPSDCLPQVDIQIFPVRSRVRLGAKEKGVEDSVWCSWWWDMPRPAETALTVRKHPKLCQVLNNTSRSK